MATEYARRESHSLGKPAQQSYRPAYLTDVYLDRLIANWKLLSPRLELDSYSKRIGRLLRECLQSEDTNHSAVKAILDRQQALTFAFLTGKTTSPADFMEFQTQLFTQLGFGQRFDRSASDHQSLALVEISEIRRETSELFSRIDNGLAPADAAKVKAVLTSIFTDVGQMAQSEMEFVMSASAGHYGPDSESRLTTSEKKRYAILLAKARFTRDDFALLKEFYAGPYERLSDRGKDELGYRVHAGLRGSE